ncbi:unnamed protein product [Mytilus coruscus]|uniref:Uncharacterized protein n=1 Tax=Mytilus coruscus TaxID=42192 RepID=A0A6J8DTV1_MYTCO|nr:unnamed protein product [Mytilus coruscus]
MERTFTIKKERFPEEASGIRSNELKGMTEEDAIAHLFERAKKCSKKTESAERVSQLTSDTFDINDNKDKNEDNLQPAKSSKRGQLKFLPEIVRINKKRHEKRDEKAADSNKYTEGKTNPGYVSLQADGAYNSIAMYSGIGKTSFSPATEDRCNLGVV